MLFTLPVVNMAERPDIIEQVRRVVHTVRCSKSPSGSGRVIQRDVIFSGKPKERRAAFFYLERPTLNHALYPDV